MKYKIKLPEFVREVEAKDTEEAIKIFWQLYDLEESENKDFNMPIVVVD